MLSVFIKNNCLRKLIHDQVVSWLTSFDTHARSIRQDLTWEQPEHSDGAEHSGGACMGRASARLAKEIASDLHS